MPRLVSFALAWTLGGIIVFQSALAATGSEVWAESFSSKPNAWTIGLFVGVLHVVLLICCLYVMGVEGRLRTVKPRWVRRVRVGQVVAIGILIGPVLLAVGVAAVVGAFLTDPSTPTVVNDDSNRSEWAVLYSEVFVVAGATIAVLVSMIANAAATLVDGWGGRPQVLQPFFEIDPGVKANLWGAVPLIAEISLGVIGVYDAMRTDGVDIAMVIPLVLLAIVGASRLFK